MDGHDFIDAAIENGAVAVVAEELGEEWEDVAAVRVADSRRALSHLAVRFYEEPYKKMSLVGITGTNGKTTTAYILESILSAAGAVPGVIGTVNYRFPGHVCKAPVTTPESMDLMRDFRKMAEGGVTHVVMEVSSHALDQKRTEECPFQVAIFTNLSRDHLDYHGSMEAYTKAKSRLFRGLRKQAWGRGPRAVINLDDPVGRSMTQVTEATVVSYGLGPGCDVTADHIQITSSGLRARLHTPWGDADIRSSLIGEFNIYNIMAASAAAFCLGLDAGAVVSGIARLEGVPGRLERVRNRRSLNIVVDYAHTPDALLKVLKALRPSVDGRLISVFGCGGDRDRGKRAQMGRVGGELSDVVIITSDNPRTEEPASIAAQVEEGVREAGLKKPDGPPSGSTTSPFYLVELDRAMAIRTAVDMAGKDDLVLIAGKGHEDYQIIGKKKRDFDDRLVAAAASGGM
jgi:UDP-N-acetylmuramoyl-L-alanyl-D-glutamate--2,6-diaminopimelate ligase